MYNISINELMELGKALGFRNLNESILKNGLHNLRLYKTFENTLDEFLSLLQELQDKPSDVEFSTWLLTCTNIEKWREYYQFFVEKSSLPASEKTTLFSTIMRRECFAFNCKELAACLSQIKAQFPNTPFYLETLPQRAILFSPTLSGGWICSTTEEPGKVQQLVIDSTDKLSTMIFDVFQCATNNNNFVLFSITLFAPLDYIPMHSSAKIKKQCTPANYNVSQRIGIQLNGCTLLHLLCLTGAVEEIQTLKPHSITKTIVNTIYFNGKTKYTPLHYAILNGDFAVIEHLLHLGALPVPLNEENFLPHLHMACLKNRVDIVKALLRHAEFKQEFIYPWQENGPFEIASLQDDAELFDLLAPHALPNLAKIAYLICENVSEGEVFDYLLKKYGDKIITICSQQVWKKEGTITPVEKAVRVGNLTILQKILSYKEVKSKLKSADIWELFRHAHSANQDKVVDFLLTEEIFGTHVRNDPYFLKTAALSDGTELLVQRFLKQGVPITYYCLQQVGSSPKGAASLSILLDGLNIESFGRNSLKILFFLLHSQAKRSSSSLQPTINIIQQYTNQHFTPAEATIDLNSLLDTAKNLMIYNEEEYQTLKNNFYHSVLVLLIKDLIVSEPTERAHVFPHLMTLTRDTQPQLQDKYRTMLWFAHSIDTLATPYLDPSRIAQGYHDAIKSFFSDHLNPAINAAYALTKKDISLFLAILRNESVKHKQLFPLAIRRANSACIAYDHQNSAWHLYITNDTQQFIYVSYKETQTERKEIFQKLLNDIFDVVYDSRDTRTDQQRFHFTLLTPPSFNEKEALCKTLTQALPPIKPSKTLLNQYKDTLLHTNTLIGCNEEVQKILRDKKEDVNQANVGGETPLHIVGVTGNLEIAQLLTENGAQMLLDGDGQSALFLACHFGHTELVHYFLQQRERLEITPAIFNGNQEKILSPLQEAIRQKHSAIISLLLENGADLQILMKAGDVPGESFKNLSHEKRVQVLYASCEYGHLTYANYLFDYGDFEEQVMREALTLAYHHNKIHIFTRLIKQDTKKYSSFTLPEDNDLEKQKIFSEILRANSPKVTVNTVQHFSGEAITLFFHKKQNDIEEMGKRLYRLCQDYCYYSNYPQPKADLYAAIKRLLLSIQSTDARIAILNYIHPATNWRPLYFACSYHEKELMELLVDFGANYQLENENGISGLTLAKNPENAYWTPNKNHRIKREEFMDSFEKRTNLSVTGKTTGPRPKNSYF